MTEPNTKEDKSVNPASMCAISNYIGAHLNALLADIGCGGIATYLSKKLSFAIVVNYQEATIAIESLLCDEHQDDTLTIREHRAALILAGLCADHGLEYLGMIKKEEEQKISEPLKH